MPARAARSEGALPGGLPGLGGLPQGEVAGVLLAGHGLGALQAVELLAGELAVLGEALHSEPGAAVGDVGRALLHQGADHGEDVLDALRDLGLVIRSDEAEGVHVVVVGVDVLGGEGHGVHVPLGRTLDDLVVHVREVAHEGDIPAPVPQVPDEGVEDHEGAGVAHVGAVVDGHAAHVQADVSGADGLEVLDTAAERVVDAEGGGHGGPPETSGPNPRCPCRPPRRRPPTPAPERHARGKPRLPRPGRGP